MQKRKVTELTVIASLASTMVFSPLMPAMAIAVTADVPAAEAGEGGETEPAKQLVESETFVEGNLKYRVTDGEKHLVEVAGVASVPAGGALAIPAIVTKDGVDYAVAGISAGGIGSSNEAATSVTAVAMPQNSETFTYISDQAFQNCSAITSLAIPASVTRIGSMTDVGIGVFGPFYAMTGLKSVTFAEGSKLSLLGTDAFLDCTALESLTLPQGLEKVGSAIVSGCTSLKHLEIPSSVTEMSPLVFEGYYASNNGSPNASVAQGGKYQMRDGILYDDTSLLKAYDYCETVVVPNGITTIRENAFTSNNKLNDVTKSLTLPESLSEIGAGAFMGCTALETVDFQGNTALKEIPDGAFTGCSSLKSIDVPTGVTSIGYEAFYGCTGLESITLSEGLESIGDRAFLMIGITDGDDDFEKVNNNIKVINIPSTVKTLGEWFLGGVQPDGKTALIFQGDTPPAMDEDVLAVISGENVNAPTVYYPAGAEAAYTAAGSALVEAGLVAPSDDGEGREQGYALDLSDMQLKASGKREVAVTAPSDAAVECSSDNDAVATVTYQDGKLVVTGVSCGSATVLARITVNGVTIASDECVVTVGHELSKVDAVAATCTKAGNIEYWTCSVCEKLFLDEAGTKEVTADETIVPATGEHKFEAEWAVDAKSHWHECSVCGAKADEAEHAASEWTANDTDHWHICEVCEAPFDIDAHDFGDWKVTKEPTATEAGEREHTCKTCGKVVAEAIPSLGEEKPTDQKPAGKPKTDSALPKTGDDSAVPVVAAGLAGAAAIAAGAVVAKRRKSE